MGATDGNINPGLPASAPSGVERVGFLDQWISRRIAEAEAAEARLAKRLEHVGRADQSLRGLLDSLRGQVAEAFPLVHQLTEFRQQAEATVRDVLGSSRSQFSQAVELVRLRIEAMREAERSLEQKLEELDQRGRDSALETEKRLGETIAKARGQAGELLDGLPKSVSARLEVFKQEVERAMASASRIVAQRTEQFEKTTGVFEEWLEAEIARQKAGQQQLAADLLERFEQELRRRIGPLARQMREIQQAQAAITRGGEEKLKQRLARVREEIDAALESAQRMFAQRVSQMIGGARAMVELHEGQLAGLVESLRPKAGAAASAVEAELMTRLANMEQQAEAALRRIEERLMRRLEGLVERGRGVLTAEAMPAEEKPEGFVAAMRQLQEGRQAMEASKAGTGESTVLGDGENISLAAPISVEVFTDSHTRSPKAA
jgi:hypothetical protein